MASKPVAQVPSAQVPSMSINLKRTFENAVRDIYQTSVTGKASNYRRPILQRPRVAVESSANREKKALSDAAKALAQLWKIAPNSSR
ncbi:MAG: hypothetical protein LAP86_19850 [Acidobacteriia bacterium]|nr:hypothetical protein [Terriglobia bacterium]